MASKPSSAAFKKVAKLADNVSENRIELALALATWRKRSQAASLMAAKTRPKERRMFYYLLKVGRWLKPIGQPHSRYAKIGWAELAILAEHSERHPHKWAARAGLARAEHCIAKELPEVLNGSPLAPYQTERTSSQRIPPPDAGGVRHLRDHPG